MWGQGPRAPAPEQVGIHRRVAVARADMTRPSAMRLWRRNDAAGGESVGTEWTAGLASDLRGDVAGDEAQDGGAGGARCPVRTWLGLLLCIALGEPFEP
jgi:hypothetical protein